MYVCVYVKTSYCQISGMKFVCINQFSELARIDETAFFLSSFEKKNTRKCVLIRN